MSKKTIKAINRSIITHGDKKVSIIIPKDVHPSIAGYDDGKGTIEIFANGTGYEFLKDIFACAMELKENSFIYLPIKHNTHRVYREILEEEKHNYNLNLIFINYHSFKANAKDIISLIRTKIFQDSLIEINVNYPNKEPDFWKKSKKLTVKRVSDNIILSSNRDIYASLCNSASDLSEYGDDIENNKYPPHHHFDWREPTSKSDGITLYYEHDESYNI